MMNYEVLERAYHTLRQRWPAAKPRGGFVLGSGWGVLIEAFEIRDALSFDEIPGLGVPGVEGHAGRLLWASGCGAELLIFQGRRHWYEGEGWTPIALPIYAFKKFGVNVVLLTNAAGGIAASFEPGDLMVLRDHINLIGNPLVGSHNPFWGPRFPDMGRTYDPELRRTLQQVSRDRGENLADGVYVAVSGPSYETPAEIKMMGSMGAHAVGMSTAPEAILASSAGLRVAALSCITNLAAGVGGHTLSHQEVTDTTSRIMNRITGLVHDFWGSVVTPA